MVEALNAVNPTNGNVAYLSQRLEEVTDKQGFIGKAWNGFKEFLNVGLSQSDCESMLARYERGEISFEEAAQYIESFDKKQTDMTGLITNIATGVGSIAVATAATAVGGPAAFLLTSKGAIGWGASVALGAPTGGVIKTAISTLDRATNDIEGDALDGKKMAKEFISGALTGTTSAISSGVGAGIRSGNFGLTVRNGVKCGLECGAVSGSLGYMTDVAFGDEEFNAGTLVGKTATSALVSGSVGAIVGSSMYGISDAIGTAGKEVTKTTTERIIQDSASSSARKVLNQAERNVAGVAIGAIASNVTNK